MKVKEFRDLLKAKSATWTISPEIADDIQVEDISKLHGLGSLPAPAGARTAFMPRMRRPEADGVLLYDAGTPRPLRTPVAAPPAAWDWRNVSGHDWITAARDQGGCGSCVAFASLGAVEAHRRIESQNAAMPVDLSEAALFFSNDRQCLVTDPRFGWSVPPALDYLVGQGICDEVNYPYRDVDQTAALVDGTQRTLRIRGYDSTTSAATMKGWLCQDGPLVTTFTVYQDFDTFWGGSNGVYRHVSGNVRGGHAVLAVGYDDTQSCWICKNSWNTNASHPDGCFRIGYGQCGIDSRMYVIQNVYDIVTVDEIAYNPRTLRIVDQGASGWLLTDGASRMKMFDNKEDARNGMCVAHRYTRQGFVGRDNPRANRIDYIMEYWTGSSGLPLEPLTKVDAIPYNPVNVRAVDADALGWRIQDGNSSLLLAHDLDDALAMLWQVERHTRMCFIGRGNNRPNRKSYIMTYWE